MLEIDAEVGHTEHSQLLRVPPTVCRRTIQYPSEGGTGQKASGKVYRGRELM